MRKQLTIFLCAAVLFFFFATGARAAEYIVIGDTRPDVGNEDFQMTESIIKDAIDYVVNNSDEPVNLDGIILTGDYVSKGTDSSQWNKFLAAYKSALFYPIYPCPGNHDDEPDNFAYYQWNYYKIFNVPRWYSVNIGSVHLISLDSNLAEFNPLAPYQFFLNYFQQCCLKDDLNKNEQPFTIVIWHEPAYTSHPASGTGHGSNLLMRYWYVPLCEEFGVDIVLSGHNHWYERTVPILKGTAADAGIVYLTTGGGGAKLYPVSDDPADKLHDKDGVVLSAVNASAYHFCILSIEDDSLTVQAVEYGTHKILDSFEVNKK